MESNIPGTIQNRNQKISKTWNTVCYGVPNKQKPSTIPSRKCNNCVWESAVQHVAKIYERYQRVKTEKLKFVRDKFYCSFLSCPKCPTMSLLQETSAFSTSNLILGLKEFTKVVESPTLGHRADLAASKLLQVSKYSSECKE